MPSFSLRHHLRNAFHAVVPSLVLAAGLAGCGDKDEAATTDTAVTGQDAAADAAPDADATAVDATVAAGPDLGHPDCDPLMPAGCALPWPSNLFLAPNAKRKTGFQLEFGAKTLPVSVGGKSILPDPYRRLDGYSVGTSLLMLWPELDTKGLASEADLAPSVAKDARIVWLEIEGAPGTGKSTVVRQIPYFAELDLQEPDPKAKLLLVRPGVILKEATRYVIGVRGLVDKAGKGFARSPAFDLLATGKTQGTVLAPRQARFDELLGLLGQHGVAKDELQLAWDFVTSSSDALHGDMLQVRDLGYAAAGPQGPELTITQIKELTLAQSSDIALEITGTFHVPQYVKPHQVGGFSGSRVNLGPDGNVVQNGWSDPTFWLQIPRSALKGSSAQGEPHGLVMYGHGLNGSGSQVLGDFNGKIANQHKLIFFACSMTGMSGNDVPGILSFIYDMAGFSILPERLHQGMLEHLLLARGMRERLEGLPQLQKYGLMVDKKQLFYSGISQGGIYGATVMALSQDIERGHLGVPGNNYGMLLHRSVDFDEFFLMVRGVYPDALDQSVVISAVQLLWDRVDPVTYYRHLSQAPFPNTKPHHVLLASATGDYQVALVTNETAVRSNLGVELLPGYGKPVFGVTPVTYPHKGSGLVNYSFGNPWAPPGNQTPPKDVLGDPHGKPRKLDHHNEQMVHFFRTGEIKDVCGGNGCTPD